MINYENEELIKENLFKLADVCETKQLADIFSRYMRSIGVRKLDRRKKNNINTYLADGSCTNWNRVECYHYNKSINYSEEILDITLRKRAGFYLIIGKEGERAFERSFNEIVHYDKDLLYKIIKEYEPLFEKLFQLV